MLGSITVDDYFALVNTIPKIANRDVAKTAVDFITTIEDKIASEDLFVSPLLLWFIFPLMMMVLLFQLPIIVFLFRLGQQLHNCMTWGTKIDF